MSRTWRIGGFVLALTILTGWSATAQTRIETLRWNDANDTIPVTGYRVHFGSASRNYGAPIDVGIPPTDGTGAFSFDLPVAAGADVFIALTAYNDTDESFFSSEQCRGPSGACSAPPPPPPPPPPPGNNAAVVGFALWDAQTDRIVDSDFVSGEQIDLSTHACTAIEVLPNDYLVGSGPGSVMYSFDGQTPSACNNPGLTHENNAPFAWEEDSGPDTFECAASLTQPGNHTLTVTPFDGDNCTGTERTPVTLDFSIVDGGEPPPPPPPPPPPLGRPGTPFLINE